MAKMTQLPEFLPGTGLNPFTWPPGSPIWGGQTIKPWHGDNLSEDTVRHLAGLAALGISDTYPDPERGNLSLSGIVLEQHSALKWRTDEGALISWHLWGLRATGFAPDDERVRTAESWLSALQQEDGSVPCSPRYTVSSVDCTGWALIAMNGSNEAFQEKGAAFLQGHQHENGGFGERGPNLQATVWAATALGLGPNSTAGDFVRSLQADDGKFHCVSLETGCSHSWVVSEALAFLQGNYPLTHRTPPIITGPEVVQAGELAYWNANVPVTWHDGRTGYTFAGAFQENFTIYAEDDGWAKLDVTVLGGTKALEREAPYPALFLLGFLACAAYRRK